MHENQILEGAGSINRWNQNASEGAFTRQIDKSNQIKGQTLFMNL